MIVPNFYQIPIRAGISAGIGYVIGKLSKASPSQWAKVFAIQAIVDSILFILICQPIKGEHKRTITYACSNLFVSIIGIFAMRHLNMIATTGTLILTGLNAWNIIIIYKHTQLS